MSGGASSAGREEHAAKYPYDQFLGKWRFYCARCEVCTSLAWPSEDESGRRKQIAQNVPTHGPGWEAASSLFGTIVTLLSFMVPPFLALPRELIQRVFLVLSQDSKSWRYTWLRDDRSFPSSYPWIPLSQVCRALREAALSYPVLWTCIDCDHQTEWTEKAAHLAQGLPLELRIGYAYEREQTEGWHLSTIFPKVAHQADKWLVRRVDGNMFSAVVGPALAQPGSPLLHTLAFEFQSDGSIFFHLPLHVFNDSPPPLKEMTLSSVFLRREVFSSSIPTLRKLSLTNVTFPAEESQPPVLPEFLSQFPGLEDLHLGWAHYYLDSLSLEGRYDLLLDNLHYLSLTDEDLSAISIILGYLPIPAKTLTIRVSSGGDVEDGNLDSLLQYVSTFWQAVESRVADSNYLELEFGTGQFESPNAHPSYVKRARLSCQKASEYYCDLFLEPLSDLHAGTMISTLTTSFDFRLHLIVHEWFEFNHAEWLGVLLQCERIAFAEGNPIVLSSFTSRMDSNKKLKEIVIFNGSNCIGDFNGFGGWLKGRKDAGIGLEFLQIGIRGRVTNMMKLKLMKLRHCVRFFRAEHESHGVFVSAGPFNYHQLDSCS